jgi:hypothetical protein
MRSDSSPRSSDGDAVKAARDPAQHRQQLEQVIEGILFQLLRLGQAELARLRVLPRLVDDAEAWVEQAQRPFECGQGAEDVGDRSSRP